MKIAAANITGKMLGSPLVLASASVGRQLVLTQAGISFSVDPADIDESCFRDLAPRAMVTALSRAKAIEVDKRCNSRVIVAADTVVCLGIQVLGKPRTLDEAKWMLRTLSGQTHRVLTGVMILDQMTRRSSQFSVTTRVQMKRLEETEIDWYTVTGEPLGKAGAYAIQGKGARFVDRVSGDYSNLLGLPLARTIQALLQMGITDIYGK